MARDTLCQIGMRGRLRVDDAARVSDHPKAACGVGSGS